MFKAFFTMLTQLFSMLGRYINVAENVAISLENVSEVGVITSGAYVDEARADRAQKLVILKQETKALKAEVSAKA